MECRSCGDPELVIDIDPAAQKFQLIPIPGEIEKAIREGEDRVFQKLKAELGDADVQVFYGMP